VGKGAKEDGVQRSFYKSSPAAKGREPKNGPKEGETGTVRRASQVIKRDSCQWSSEGRSKSLSEGNRREGRHNNTSTKKKRETIWKESPHHPHGEEVS